MLSPSIQYDALSRPNIAGTIARTFIVISVILSATITNDYYGRHNCSLYNHRYNGDLAIGPHLIPDYPFSLPELLKGAFIPFTDEATHMKLFDSGQRCAEAWLRLETPRQARN
jgi:hypothetical protein